MSARQRESVSRSPSSDSQMTFSEFMRAFPTNDACLEYLKERFYPDGTKCPNPKCGKASRFHRIKGRSAYSCQYCGHHVYPTAGTIFHKSSTSLQLWFWAIYLVSSTRCGISAKQLGREIGVTYKTAWRMFNLIRSLMQEDASPLSGSVEIDETYVGGKRRGKGLGKRGGPAAWDHLTPVFAGVERGGKVFAQVVPNARALTLMPIIKERVLPDSMIYTDEYRVYDRLSKHGYTHERVNHLQRVWVAGNATTNQIEGFFGLFKNGVRGVYHSVSRKHLQSYLNEYTFRYNRRDGREPIFWAILDRVQKDGLADA
jgi:transposase